MKDSSSVSFAAESAEFIATTKLEPPVLLLKPEDPQKVDLTLRRKSILPHSVASLPEQNILKAESFSEISREVSNEGSSSESYVEEEPSLSENFEGRKGENMGCSKRIFR